MIAERNIAPAVAKPFACPTCGRSFRIAAAVDQHIADTHAKRKKTPAKKPKVVCQSCGNEAAVTQTRYGERHSCCGMWSWDGKPLADRETHEARIAAHAAFDPLWKSKLVKRSYAYALLRREMNLSEPECHMSVMTAETARRVPAAVERIRASLIAEVAS